jgi:hypothetical protein
MTIQRQRHYNEAEVKSILLASERRTSITGQTGHAGRRHVLITNQDLMDRGQAFYDQSTNDVPLVCAFTETPEAVRAVTEALNSPQGQAALQHLDGYLPMGTRVCIEARVSPFRARYSPGMEIRRTVTITSVFVLVESIWEAPYHGIHIHTAFPILAFRHQGQPAWRDHLNAWH